MRRWAGRALLIGPLALWPVSRATGADSFTKPGKPMRIVSLNLCADQILLDLVPRNRIAALSILAADPQVSAAAGKARGIVATRGEAEVVLGLDPDLVIAGTFSTAATVSLLERIGRRVVKVPLAADLDGVGKTVRLIADAVGERGQGEAVVAAFEARLNASRLRVAPPHPSALVYQVNGLASGAGSLADDMLKAAGFRNLVDDLKLGTGGTLPLESLIAHPPDLLVLSGPVDEYRTAVADNLRHPALAALRRERASLVLPWRTWLCGTPYIADAIETLRNARETLMSKTGQAVRP